MTNEELFGALTEVAKAELGEEAGDQVQKISFSVMFTATNDTGGILGGALRIDPEGEAIGTVDELIVGGSVPSLVTYILMKQSAGILDRCLAAALMLKGEAEKEKQ